VSTRARRRSLRPRETSSRSQCSAGVCVGTPLPGALGTSSGRRACQNNIERPRPSCIAGGIAQGAGGPRGGGRAIVGRGSEGCRVMRREDLADRGGYLGDRLGFQWFGYL
jgi:hypothetical protein